MVIKGLVIMFSKEEELRIQTVKAADVARDLESERLKRKNWTF